MQCTDTLAFEAAAALAAYEEQLDTLQRSGPHPRSVAAIQGALGHLCNRCLRLPQLSGAGISLLLAHHRMLAELARGPVAAPAAGLQELERCIRTLRRACRELFLAPHLH